MIPWWELNKILFGPWALYRPTEYDPKRCGRRKKITLDNYEGGEDEDELEECDKK